VDKKALPSPEGLGMSTGVEYVAARNEVEEKLVAIWEEVLGREKIGVKDNFFDLGGHSLIAMQMISRINKEFDVIINFMSLFGNPTIEGLNDEIEKIHWANKELEEVSNESENFSI
jgi:tyrocidine synthetase-3